MGSHLDVAVPSAVHRLQWSLKCVLRSALPYVRLSVCTTASQLWKQISSSFIASGTLVHLGHHQIAPGSILAFSENLSILSTHQAWKRVSAQHLFLRPRFVAKYVSPPPPHQDKSGGIEAIVSYTAKSMRGPEWPHPDGLQVPAHRSRGCPGYCSRTMHACDTAEREREQLEQAQHHPPERGLHMLFYSLNSLH